MSWRWMAWSALATVALLLAASVSAGGSRYPLGWPATEFEYLAYQQRAVRTGEVHNLAMSGPIAQDQLVGDELVSTPVLRLFDDPAEGDVRLVWLATERVAGRCGNRTHDYPHFTGGFSYSPSPHLYAVALFSLDRKKALDPAWVGKRWRGLAGDVDYGGIGYARGGLQLFLGRQKMYWGPRPNSLVLSSNAEPMDMLAAQYRRGRLHFHFFMAQLDQSRPDSVDTQRFPDYTFTSDNRYLVGHRLDVRLHRRFQIGLFETTVFGGGGRAPELYYLNPLQFFHAAQLNQDVNDNTLLGADFAWLPFDGWSVYGQFLVDDLQVDNQSQADQEPDEVGYLAGFYRAGSEASFDPDVRIEYTRIANRTYHQLHPRNRYLHRNQPIGHPLGMDGDSVSLLLRFWPSHRQAIMIEIAHTRHGQGSLQSAWTEPWMLVTGDYDETFPSGAVEHTTSLKLGYQGYPPVPFLRGRLLVTSQVGFESEVNAGNVNGHDQDSWWFRSSLTLLGLVDIATGQ